MPDSIKELNAILTSERNKTENLLNENISLKSRSYELQILTENLLHSQNFHNKLEFTSSCKAFESRFELITEADLHHKDIESQISTTIQLSNNEQSRKSNKRDQTRPKENFHLCKARECNKNTNKENNKSL